MSKPKRKVDVYLTTELASADALDDFAKREPDFTLGLADGDAFPWGGGKLHLTAQVPGKPPIQAGGGWVTKHVQGSKTSYTFVPFGQTFIKGSAVLIADRLGLAYSTPDDPTLVRIAYAITKASREVFAELVKDKPDGV